MVRIEVIFTHFDPVGLRATAHNAPWRTASSLQHNNSSNLANGKMKHNMRSYSILWLTQLAHERAASTAAIPVESAHWSAEWSPSLTGVNPVPYLALQVGFTTVWLNHVNEMFYPNIWYIWIYEVSRIVMRYALSWMLAAVCHCFPSVQLSITPPGVDWYHYALTGVFQIPRTPAFRGASRKISQLFCGISRRHRPLFVFISTKMVAPVKRYIFLVFVPRW